MEVRIARRYAKALSEALPDEKVEKVLKELRTLLEFFDEKALKYLKSPIISVDRKKTLLNSVLEKIPISDELSRVLQLMAEKDRLGLLREFYEEFENFANEKLGIVRAEIISATELDGETVRKIETKIEELFGKKPEISIKLDPSLIGGFIVKVADKVIDASIKTQLENLKKSMS